MSWFNKAKAGLDRSAARKVKVPAGMWVKCPGCSASILSKDIEANLQVCPKCGHHYRISARRRLDALLDDAKWQEFDSNMTSVDFHDLWRFTLQPNSPALQGGVTDVQRHFATGLPFSHKVMLRF